MKIILYLLVGCFTVTMLCSCGGDEEISSVDPINWSKRKATPVQDSLMKGKSYLSVYSAIYSETEHLKYNLTATTSIRNTSDTDTIYITKANYYDTHGNLIRTYFDYPIYVLPMETLEIIIDERDDAGGSGANFLFEWGIDKDATEPLFEAVMISTSGQQGLSFSTYGKRIK